MPYTVYYRKYTGMNPAWYINIAVGLLLQSLLFFRAFRCRLWRYYPFFYSYLTYTAVRSVVLSLPLIIRQPFYSKLYWWSHVLAALLRFGIGADIHRYVFPRNSQVRATAGTVVISALALLAFLFWVGGAGPGHYMLDTLRKIALSVAAWILIVLGLAHHYGIRIGRNVLGMAVGLLIFTGSELVHLAAMDLVPRLSSVWSFVHPIAFVFMLMIWTSTLWRYSPNPGTSVLDEASARELLSIWQDRWEQIPVALRKLVKP